MVIGSILGAVLLFAAVAVPWGSLLDWAREEIKSKPRNDVV
jgi:hypothetical protein